MITPVSSPARTRFRDVMRHPVVIAAVAMLVLNDHVLKARWPGTLTGKLSDVAGLIFFPLILLALAEWMGQSMGKAPRISRLHLLVAIVLTGLGFIAIETLPAVADPVAAAWGWLRSPMEGMAAQPMWFTPDLSDLLALPALAVAWGVGSRRCLVI